jgi:hypothetical protein
LRLFEIAAEGNLSLVGTKSNSEYIMNIIDETNVVARLAQGLLAVTIVFAIGLAFQLTLKYEGRGIYVAAGEAYGVPQTTASRFS